MKTDMVDSGVGGRNPSLLYGIDKLSMDKVTVFPDGEINVQAVRTDREPMDHGGMRPCMPRGVGGSAAGAASGAVPLLRARTPPVLGNLANR
eukprot:532569-Prorocentrum_minimum.AAC.1